MCKELLVAMSSAAWRSCGLRYEVRFAQGSQHDDHGEVFSFFRPQMALPIKTGGEVLGVPTSIGKERRGRPGKAGVDYQGHTGRQIRRRGDQPSSSRPASWRSLLIERPKAIKGAPRGRGLQTQLESSWRGRRCCPIRATWPSQRSRRRAR